MFAKSFAIEPVMPPLSDAFRAKAERVVIEASTLRLPAETEVAFRCLLQQMNCYYSNLIEGVNTHPVDIDRALRQDYSDNRDKRRLQVLALGHAESEAEVCRLVISGVSPFGVEAALSAHRVLYQEADKATRTLQKPDGSPLVMSPGEWRETDVQVGIHIAPPAENIEALIRRMDQVYSSTQTQTDRLIAVAAHHHRFAWTHPFPDGNGRAVRLLSQGALYWVGIASPLWSIARGLAKQRNRYYEMLHYADNPRQGDLDGRGNLSEKALVEFVSFFLDVCLDQITFMRQLLSFEPTPAGSGLKNRLLASLRYLSATKGDTALKEEAATPIFYAFLTGEVTSTEFEQMTGLAPRTAQRTLKSVVEHGFLRRGQKRGVAQPYHFAIPLDGLTLLFPGLYDAAGAG